MAPHILVLLVATGIWHGSASPTINSSLSTVIVNKGDPVNFLCHGKSIVEWVGIENRSKVNVSMRDTNSSLRIDKASCTDMGTYQCAYTNSTDMETAAVTLIVREPGSVWCVEARRIKVTKGSNARLPCLFTAPAYDSITLRRDNMSPVLAGISFSFSAQSGITIHNVKDNYLGFYWCQALIKGKEERSMKIKLIVTEATTLQLPSVTMNSTTEYVRILGEPFHITCNLTFSSYKYDFKWSHPLGKVTIINTSNFDKEKYIVTSNLSISSVQLDNSGRYTCMGNNSAGYSNSSVVLQVIERGYVRLSTIQNSNQEVNLGESLRLQVLIEAYPKLHNSTWTHKNPFIMSQHSIYTDIKDVGNNRYNTVLPLDRMKEEESGVYTFFAENNADSALFTFNVSLKVPLLVYVSTNGSNILLCTASGYPTPRIEWYQVPLNADRCIQRQRLILNDTNPQIVHKNPFGRVVVKSTLAVEEIESNVTFCCMAINREENESTVLQSLVQEVKQLVPNVLSNPALAACVGTMTLLVLCLIFLFYKYKQKPKYQVRWKIIEASEGNNYIFIDPTQLPYCEKWEFPRDKLQFGKTLGAGAFGKVVEATAYGLGKEDFTLKVAVKMLKSTAHNDEQEALMSELKIMSHLGHHENIVNLLGACTHGGPVLVITEYCRYGDLLNFLRRTAENLLIQNLGWGSSPNSTSDYKNIYLEKKYVRSDSGFGSQCVDAYIEMRPASSDSTPTTRNCSENEEQEDTSLLDLYDLLQFSNHVAQGMAFLASKNCIHRDLAARNVLVTNGRVAKICDFGLARDIMNDSNYVVKGNARLPVKWMAPESIFECIYTVQSDVWSYGILLWEIFSLGGSPYPGMKVNGKFYSQVKQGYKMARPEFAPMETYSIMKACWNLQPTQRPTFDQICCFIQKQLDASKEQAYTNLPSSSKNESVCKPSICCEVSCDPGESSQPLLNANNYEFC
uniref:receptor protein-tyrosine kinase n=1 Tax=Sphenodon punctatus TaxID=8508 RepID=A0A8D0GYU3_SPHPU